MPTVTAKMPFSAYRQRVDEREVPQPDFDVVGFAEDDLKRFRRYIRNVRMVLVTVPLVPARPHALRSAQRNQDDEDKIITIEDPVEYQIRGITQSL